MSTNENVDGQTWEEDRGKPKMEGRLCTLCTVSFAIWLLCLCGCSLLGSVFVQNVLLMVHVSLFWSKCFCFWLHFKLAISSHAPDGQDLLVYVSLALGYSG